MHTFEVLKRPVVTEKSTLLQEKGCYTFEVARSATKQQIKEAVEKAFGVEVVQVNTLTVRDKPRRYGPRLVPARRWKKAIVTLAPGNSITIFEGV